jgi:DNA polymerase III alpha subunit
VKRRIDIDLAAIPSSRQEHGDLRPRLAVGIFQLESAGCGGPADMRPTLRGHIALVALYRPSTANIPTYCARKHGMEKPDYIHPARTDPAKPSASSSTRTGDAGRADPRGSTLGQAICSAAPWARRSARRR